VTVALLCATSITGDRDDLAAALSAAGARDVRVLTGDVGTQRQQIAELARTSAEPLLLCADDLVAHAGLLRLLATEPGGRSTALVVADSDGDLREDRGRLLAAGPGAATARFLGALWISAADLPMLAAAASTDNGAAGGAAGGAIDVLLPALLDGGVLPVATRVRLLHAERVTDDAGLTAARAAVAAIDEDRALLRLAVKEKDDFFTTYAVSSWSPLVTRLCARLRMTPSGVTLVSILFVVVAALGFWQASRPAMIIGGVLLYLGFMLDCVDGQLARYTRSFGAFGGWIDTMADRAKEYIAYAGLAAGAERIGLPYAWPLAIAAMLLQTVRHMTDAWYGALHDEAAKRPSATPTGGMGARLSQASDRVQADTGSVAYWAKRIIVFPIGERWALIAILAAFADGRVVLIAVLAWGLFAAAYTLGLRSLRSRAMRVPVLATVDVPRHRDDGPLARHLLGRAGAGVPLAFATLGTVAAAALAVAAGRTDVPSWLVAVAALAVLSAGLSARAPHAGALDWLVPAALRAAEYLFVVAVALVYAVPAPLVFVLVFALGLHHYDLTARMEKLAPAGRIPVVTGWDGRVLILAVAAIGGWATAATAVVAGYVLGMFVVGAVTSWSATRRPVVVEGGPR
jgi:phosphatidylglycerophosphate synthase